MMGPTYMYHGKLCSHTYTMYTACLYILHLHTDLSVWLFQMPTVDPHPKCKNTKCYVIKSCDILLENLTKSPVRSWCVRSSWERCLGSIWCVRSSGERCLERIWCVRSKPVRALPLGEGTLDIAAHAVAWAPGSSFLCLSIGLSGQLNR